MIDLNLLQKECNYLFVLYNKTVLLHNKEDCNNEITEVIQEIKDVRKRINKICEGINTLEETKINLNKYKEYVKNGFKLIDYILNKKNK